MAINENLLAQVREAGVELWVEGDQLRYRMPKTPAATLALAQIRPHKEQIIASLKDAGSSQDGSIREKLGLNPAQSGSRYFPMRVEQIWRIEYRRDGDAPKVPFDIPHSKLLGGGIEIESLQEAITTVVGRHEALRARLAIEEERPVQVVAKPGLPKLDVVTVEEADFRTGVDLQRAAGQLSDPPIDLQTENGFRCRIFRDGHGNVALGTVFHHYFCDQWSVRLLMREIDECYLALSRRETPNLAPVTNQYGDYAAWQRHALAADFPQTLNYWKRSLANVPPSRLPYDHVLDTRNMTVMHFHIGADLGGRLKSVARGQRVSFFVVLLAAYQILLAKWCGEEQILNAVSVADRFDAMYSNTMGYLITALPICGRVHSAMSIASFMENLSVTMADAYLNRALSYELYDEIFSPQQPFCTSLFNYIAFESLAAPSGARTASEHAVPTLGNTFPRKLHHRELYFELIEVSQGLRGRLFFNTDFFKKETIEAVISRYIAILEQMAARPGGNIGQLD